MADSILIPLQFSVELINRQVQFTTDVVRFVDKFNITVALVSRLVPAWEHTVETVWYDCRSFAESLYGKYIHTDCVAPGLLPG